MVNKLLKCLKDIRVIFLCPTCGIWLCFVTTGPNITFYSAMNASFTVVWHMCLLYLHFIHWFDKVNSISTFLWLVCHCRINTIYIQSLSAHIYFICTRFGTEVCCLSVCFQSSYEYIFIGGQCTYSIYKYIQINTWAFPYWPGYHPETPILARDGVECQYGSRDDNQANMEMPMY